MLHQFNQIDMDPNQSRNIPIGSSTLAGVIGIEEESAPRPRSDSVSIGQSWMPPDSTVKIAVQPSKSEVSPIKPSKSQEAGLEGQLDEKDYRIEQFEINELFADSQQNNGGICLQLTLTLVCILFVLIDTSQIATIQGALRTVTFFTEDSYLAYKKEQAFIERRQEPNLSEESRILDSLITNSGLEIISGEYSEQEGSDSFIASEREGQVLKFVRTTEDFYDWFEFVVESYYRKDLGDAENYFQQSQSSSDISVEQRGKIMMNSSVMVGSRLIVQNAQTDAVPKNSPFEGLIDAIRVHNEHQASFDTVDANHISDDAFIEYLDASDSGSAAEFTQYFSGNLSAEEVREKLTYLKENNIVSEEMLLMKYEMMIYSHNVHTGHLVTYNFHRSPSGVLYAEVSVQIFQPLNNGVRTSETFLRVSLQVVFLVCILVFLIYLIFRVRVKCGSLINYRLNEFNMSDLAGLIMLIDGILILVTGGQLLYGSNFNYEEHFRLPMSSYQEYLRWVESANLVEIFRIRLGVFVMVQMLNLLLIASTILPSLGILFRTIDKSLHDVFVFSTVAALVFLVFFVILHVSFGEHAYVYSTLAISRVTVFRMFLGEFPYTAMYESDPTVSATVLILFVLVINLLVYNMYTAIVVRTYAKLQARQLFLGESVAFIVRKDATKKTKHWMNLICCRSTFKRLKRRPTAEQQTLPADPEEDHETEERPNNQKFSQRFQQNLDKALERKVMTKDKFEKELLAAAKSIAEGKMLERRRRIEQLNGMNPAKSYAILKKGCVLALHLVFSWLFYLSQSESAIHADIQAPIEHDLVKHTYGTGYSLDQIQSTYTVPIKRVLDFDMASIGTNQMIGDKYRLTYRLYKMSNNTDERTNQIFPRQKMSDHSLPSNLRSQENWELSFVKVILEALSGDQIEETSRRVFAGISSDYTPQGNQYDSLYGEGGYVFTFDGDRQLKGEDGVEMNLEEFLQLTVEEQFAEEIGVFALDWTMYNANYDFLIYIALIFSYSPNGELTTTLVSQSLRAKALSVQLLTFSVFFCFYLYFLYKFLTDLYGHFKMQVKSHSAPLSAQQRQQREDRSCLLRVVNLLGIEEQRLAGQNILVVTVLCVYMIAKKLLITLVHFVRALLAYTKADVFNFFELLNTCFTTVVVIVLLQIVPMQFYQDTFSLSNENLLADLNRAAFLYEKISFNMAMSVYCLCFRLLKLPQFSLYANLPFATLIQGRKDIVNILVILFVFTVANALAAFIVFCPQISEFRTFSNSFYSLLKFYMGDFNVCLKMLEAAPRFTVFYMAIVMSLYAIFLTHMFLGIIIGHFEEEWNRIQSITRTSKESFSIVHVTYRIVLRFFSERVEEEKQKLQAEEKVRLESELDDENASISLQGSAKSKKSKAKGCCAKCDCRNFSLFGLIERIVINAMLRLSLQQDARARRSRTQRYRFKDPANNSSDSDNKSETGDQGATWSKLRNKAKMLKGLKNAHKDDARLPFDLKERTWGNYSSLKTSQDHRENSSFKAYMQWYDGQAIDQHHQDKKFVGKGKLGALLSLKSAQEVHIPHSKLDAGKLLARRGRLPTSLDRVLDLEKFWANRVGEHEKGNANYWMFNLQKQVRMLSKKELSLNNFKKTNCFFSQNLLQKAGKEDLLASDATRAVLEMNTDQILSYFASPEVTVADKYRAWQAIDLVNRLKFQNSAFNVAREEKNLFTRSQMSAARRQTFDNKEQKHGNLMALLVAQLERPISQEMEHKVFQQYVVSGLSRDGNKRNPVKFRDVKSSAWRKKKYHRVHRVLQKAWRESLSTREQYKLWFQFFSTTERVRLWNQLVFTREWFKRVVTFSRKQTGYVEAMAQKERIDRERARKRTEEVRRKGGSAAKGAEQHSDEEFTFDVRDKENDFYKGFQRRDLNEMLKAHAKTMFHKGVRAEEVLLIKVMGTGEAEENRLVKKSLPSDRVKNQKTKASKMLADKTQKQPQLSEAKQQQVIRSVFTPDQMHKIWSQFSKGTYVPQLRRRKMARDQDKEDGLDAEFQVTLLNTAEEIEAEKRRSQGSGLAGFWSEYERYEERRTMDRFEQIHFFFSQMIEHNVKTLATCQNRKLEAPRITTEDSDWAHSTHTNQTMHTVQDSKPVQILSQFQSEEAGEHIGTSKFTQQKDAKTNKKRNRFELFEAATQLVIKEEERLPLWMLMSKEEKLDMLAHQCIEEEASIMNFLIEFEYGAETNFKRQGKRLEIDRMMEDALDQLVFQKYLAYTKLQALFYARKFAKEAAEKKRKATLQLYKYAEYISDLNSSLKRKEEGNAAKIKRNSDKNQLIEMCLLNKALKYEKLHWRNRILEHQKESAALAMKFYLEFHESHEKAD